MLTLAVIDPQLIQDLTTDETVQVTYTPSGSTLTLRAVTVTASAGTAPSPAGASGTGSPDASGATGGPS